MDFISGGDSASADGSAQGLVARGMTPPKGAYGSLGSEGTDHGSLKDAVGQPFDLAEVSTIFLEFMLMYRKAARLDRESSLEGQVKELLNAADKTREAAAKDFDKALAQGIASIVGGAIQGVVGTLQFVIREMEDRYRKMSKIGVRNIDGFNARGIELMIHSRTLVTVSTRKRKPETKTAPSATCQLTPMPMTTP